MCSIYVCLVCKEVCNRGCSVRGEGGVYSSAYLGNRVNEYDVSP